MNGDPTEITNVLDASVDALLKSRGFSVVLLKDPRASRNKFLGQDKPKLGGTNFKGKPRRGARNEFGTP